MMTNGLNGLYTSVDELIRDTTMGRPHVIILGAGASRQACREGDYKGRKLPLMNDFIDTVGLESVFKEYGIDYEGKNLEDIYSDLYEDHYENLAKEIEAIVVNYFQSLRLPPYPTIYDHLVLSLRKKDIIATFNWDPLLYLACWRNHKHAQLPYVCYLHGNVIIGYCIKDMRSGKIGERCPKCGNEYMRSKILFPVKKKNYNADPAIQAEWKALTDALENAYCLTIFGYGAPKSDVEAIKMMKKAWGSVWSRNLEQTEIIDIKNSKELRENWSGFIHTHHYSTTDDFYKSSVALFPRRTCEAEWNCSMPAKPVFYPQNPIPRELNFPELWEWYARLTEFENKSLHIDLI